MADANAEVFRTANLVMEEAVWTGIAAGAEATRRELLVFLTDFSRKFFPFVSIQMGKERASIPGVEWKSLSAQYRSLKSSAGDRNEFWRFSSDLQTAVSGMDATMVFGTPKVGLNIGGGSSIRSGFRQEGPRFRNLSTGQFASALTALEGVVASLVLELFPGADGLNGSALMHRMFRGSDLEVRAAVTEFGRSRMNGKSITHPARPLFLPALRYTQTTLLRAGLRNKFGINV